MDLNKICDIIIQAARSELLPRFTHVDHNFKADGTYITDADLAMQQRVQTELAALYPDTPFLGEEMDDELQSHLLSTPGQGLWCLDPLDGTSNYAAGIPYFGASLALLSDEGTQLSVVYDPCRDECFSARRNQGAWLNGRKLGGDAPTSPLAKGAGIIDFKRLPPELAARLAQAPPYSSQRSFGSVALDWCWMAAGRGHVYLHGKQKIWDYAGGELVLREAGGHSTTLDGEPVFRAQLAPRSAVAALDKTLFDQWTQWLEIQQN